MGRLGFFCLQHKVIKTMMIDFVEIKSLLSFFHLCSRSGSNGWMDEFDLNEMGGHNRYHH